MGVAWFRVPYSTRTWGNGKSEKFLPLPAASVDEFWAETVLSDTEALVRYRGSASKLASVRASFQEVVDPYSVWTPSRVVGGRTILSTDPALIVDDVPDDAGWVAMKQQVQDWISQAQNKGYFRLPKMPWRDAARYLVIAGRNGYGLDRISTGTFPTTKVLDDLTRANQALTAGDWGLWAGSGLNIVSNQMTGSPSNFGGSYWSKVQNFGPDSECFCTISDKTVDVTANGYLVGVRDDAGLNLGNSYDLYVINNTAATDNFRLRVQIAGSWSALGADMTQEITNGDGMGIEAIGTTITAYYRSGGSWSAVGNRTDSQVTGKGRLYWYCDRFGSILDDPGGGTVDLDSNIFQDWSGFPRSRPLIEGSVA